MKNCIFILLLIMILCLSVGFLIIRDVKLESFPELKQSHGFTYEVKSYRYTNGTWSSITLYVQDVCEIDLTDSVKRGDFEQLLETLYLEGKVKNSSHVNTNSIRIDIMSKNYNADYLECACHILSVRLKEDNLENIKFQNYSCNGNCTISCPENSLEFLCKDRIYL